jgi:hypothetical protein
MNQVRHIFSKDLRRLRWSVIGWSALVGARTLVQTAGADIALGGFGPQLGIGELSALLSLMYLLLLALLVSRLVHDEPLVGRDAFWITRPIAPGALMAAKLVFATLFFIVVPLAGGVIVAAAFGTGAGDIARTIPVVALNQFILATLLMALAAVTPSLTRYVLAIVGVIAAVVTLTASTILVALWVTEEIRDSSDVGLPDPTPAVVGGVLIVLTALAVIIYQYRTRRLGRALTIAGIGAAVLVLVLERWNWSFADQPRSEITVAPQDTPALTVSLDGSRPRVSDTFTLRRRTSPRKEIAAHAIATGVPPEFNVRTIVARSRLELPAGVVLQTGGNNSNAALSVYGGGSTAGRTTTVEAALGGVRLLTRSNAMVGPSSEQWPILLRVDEGDFVRHRDEPGRLTANLDLIFERAVARDALPLADGATRDISAMHVSIVRVIRRATGCTVLLRRSYVESLFSMPRYRDFMYVLRNKARGEAAGSDVESLSQEGFSTGGFSIGFSMSTPHVGGRGFVLEQYELQFPAGGRPDSPSVDLDEAWLASSELVILEAIPAGRISRTVTIDGFRMAP